MTQNVLLYVTSEVYMLVSGCSYFRVYIARPKKWYDESSKQCLKKLDAALLDTIKYESRFDNNTFPVIFDLHLVGLFATTSWVLGNNNNCIVAIHVDIMNILHTQWFLCLYHFICVLRKPCGIIGTKYFAFYQHKTKER